MNSAENEDGGRRRETMMKDGNGNGTEDGSGDEDGERRRETGRRTVPVTNPVNRAENENGER